MPDDILQNADVMAQAQAQGIEELWIVAILPKLEN
jgi:hypothetical protein